MAITTVNSYLTASGLNFREGETGKASLLLDPSTDKVNLSGNFNVGTGSFTIGGNAVMTGVSDRDTDTLQTVTDRGSSTTNAITAARFLQNSSAQSNFYAVAVNRSSTSLTSPDVFATNADGLVLGSSSSDDTLVIDTGSTVLINGGGTANTNSYKADFAVGVGSNPQVSWLGQQVQIGGTDMNWDGKIYNDGIFNIAGWARHVRLFNQAGAGSAPYDIIFSPWDGNNLNETMRIIGEGRVGIGSNNPASKLDINNGAGGSSETLLNVGGTGNGRMLVRHIDGKASNSASAQQLYLNYVSNSSVSIAYGGGNVGIGTHNPQAKLDLWGDMRLDSAGNTDRSLYFRNQNTVAKVRSDAALQFDVGVASSPSAAMYIEEDTRNVGIGTTSINAGAKVTIQAANSNQIHTGLVINSYQSTTATAGNGVGIVMGQNNGVYSSKIANVWTNNNPSYLQTNIAFYTMHDSYTAGSETEKMRLTSQGRLGIGVTNPSQRLEVNPDNDSSAILGRAHIGYVGHSDWAAFSHYGANTTTNYALRQNTNGQTILNKKNGTSLTFRNSDSTIGGFNSDNDFFVDTDTLYVDSSEGRVGIGVSDPDATLEVKGAGNSNATTSLHVRDSDDQKLFMVRNDGVVTVDHNYFYVQASAGAYVQTDLRVRGSLSNDAGTLAIHGDVNFDSNTLYVDSTNNRVGIGLTNPSNTLDVAGGAEFNAETYIRAQSNVGLRIQTIDQGLTTNDGLRVGLNGTHAFVWNLENKPLALATNNQERVTILEGGNVGIGITSPAADLNVIGHSKFNGTSYHSHFNYATDGSEDTYIRGGKAGAKVRINDSHNSDVLIAGGGGNVGIGTTSANGLLQVGKYTIASQGNQGTYGNLSSFANSDTDNIFLGLKNGSYPNRGFAFRTVANGVNSDFTIYEHGQGSAEVFRITSVGNVGIGITNPTSKLHVKGPINITRSLNSDTSNIDMEGNFRFSAQAGYRTTFFNNGSERVRFDVNGHVGIGTNSPDTLLHLQASDPVLKIRDSSTTTNSATLWLQESDTYGVKINYQSNGGDRGRDFLTIDTLSASDSNNQAGNHDNAWGIDQDGYIMPHKGAVDGNLLKSYEWLLYGSQVNGSTPSFPQNGSTAENGRIYGHNPFGEPAILWYTPSQDSQDGADGGWNSDTFIVDRGKTYRTSVWVKKETDTPADGNLYLGTNYVNNLNGTYNTNPYFIGGNLLSNFGESGQWYLMVGYIFDSGHTGTTAHPDGGIYDRNGKKLASANSFKFTNSGSPSAGLSNNFNTSRQRVYNYYDSNTGSKTYWWGPRFEPLEASTPTLQQVLNTPSSDTGAYFMGDVGIGTNSPLGTAHIYTADAGGNIATNSSHDDLIIENNGNCGIQLSSPASSYQYLAFGDTASANQGYVRYYHSDDSMTLRAGGTDTIKLKGGNVGLGVDTPDYKLHVNGAVAIKGGEAADTARIIFQASDENNRFILESDFNSVPTTDLLGFRSSNVDNILVLKGNGLVGIGTTDPDHELQIKGDVSIDNESASEPSMLHFNATNKNNLDPTSRINFWEGNSHGNTYTDSNAFIEYNGSTAGGGDGYLALGGYTNAGANQDIMVLNRLGRVGIGSLTPTYNLDVAGDVGIDQYIRHNGDTNTYFGFSAGDTIQFNTNSNERLRITSAGNVGIGVTNPNANLDVKAQIRVRDTNSDSIHAILDSNASEGRLRLNNGSNWGLIARGQANNPYLGAYYLGSLNIVGFSSSDGASVHHNLTKFDFANQRVGIGTTSPTTTLDVNGTIRMTSSLRVNNGSNKLVLYGDSSKLELHAAGSDGIIFKDAGNSEKVRLKTDGKLIVGTTSNQTQSKLTSRQNGSCIEFGHLNQGGQYYGTVGAMQSAGAPFIAFSADNSAGNTFTTRGAKGNVIHGDTSSAGELVFSQLTSATATNAATVERMRLDSDGNFGIGTSSPQAKLDVDGTIKTKVFTISALPSASPAGQRAMVNNSYYTFGSAVLGQTVYAGGSAIAPVYSDGSYWRYG